MSVNIIVKGGGKSRRSSEEVAESVARVNEEAVVREKATYMEKQRQLRKVAEEHRDHKGEFRLESVMDPRIFFRHEQDRPGSMADDTYRKELLRDSPELDCR